MKLFKLLTLNSSISFLFIKSKKKNWVEIKKIKGKISNRVDGVFSMVRKIGK